MNRIGRPESAERLAKDRSTIEDERLPPLPPVSDQRGMDERRFWDLIASAQDETASIEEQAEHIGALLGRLPAAEIKRFGVLYAKLMKRLHHWNVWALAYAARGGCSDDAFMAFRSWLILQGDSDLIERAIADPASAAIQVPTDPELPDGTLMPMIEEVHLRRAGRPVELSAIDGARPKGREWKEEELATAYPALVRHYSAA